jgi:hypothetical protein
MVSLLDHYCNTVILKAINFQYMDIKFITNKIQFTDS